MSCLKDGPAKHKIHLSRMIPALGLDITLIIFAIRKAKANFRRVPDRPISEAHLPRTAKCVNGVVPKQETPLGEDKRRWWTDKDNGVHC